MQIMPPALIGLIDALGRLPGIGKKTATRLALYLVRRPQQEARDLARALADLHDHIRLCSNCFAFSEADPCSLCADQRRTPQLICVVEGPADMLAIEKTGAFQGQYHILHGVLSPMDGIGPEEIKVEALLKRIASQQVKEILIATSSTVPGEATASYLMERLQGSKIKVSRLACGIPMGMDIKYADELTLTRAIEARRQYSEE